MDSHTDSRFPSVHRLEVVETGRRRRWSRDEKLRIIEESLTGGMSASAVARAHGIAVSQLFAWRKQLCEPAPAAPGFVPAVIRPEPASSGCIEVVCRGGRRVIVGADVDVSVLLRVVEALER